MCPLFSAADAPTFCRRVHQSGHYYVQHVFTLSNSPTLLCGVITHVSCDQASCDQTVSAVPNSPERLGRGRMRLTRHVTGLNFGLSPSLTCSSCRLPAQSHFRSPALIGYSRLARGYLPSRNMATLHGRLRGTSSGISRFQNWAPCKDGGMQPLPPNPLRARWIRYPTPWPT
jgi:hypothetical protein